MRLCYSKLNLSVYRLRVSGLADYTDNQLRSGHDPSPTRANSQSKSLVFDGLRFQVIKANKISDSRGVRKDECQTQNAVANGNIDGDRDSRRGKRGQGR